MASNARAAGRSSVISRSRGEQDGIYGAMFHALVAEPRPATIVVPARADLVVQHVANGAIELCIVGALEQHGELVRIPPIVPLAHLDLHEIVETRAGQGI